MDGSNYPHPVIVPKVLTYRGRDGSAHVVVKDAAFYERRIAAADEFGLHNLSMLWEARRDGMDATSTQFRLIKQAADYETEVHDRELLDAYSAKVKQGDLALPSADIQGRA